MRTAGISKHYPIIIGALAAFGYLLLFEHYPKYALTKGLRDLITASITISAIGIGFLATAKATIMSLASSKIVKWLKEAGAYTSIIICFMDAVEFCIASTLISGLLLLIDFQDPPKYFLCGVAIWVFATTSALVATYRIIRLFSKILQKA